MSHTPVQNSSGPRTAGFQVFQAFWVFIAITALFVLPLDASAKKKSRRGPRPEPELKILKLEVSPNPYTVSSGSAEFLALVQLPKELSGATLLEVSSLVSSPSKTSIRFLSRRTELDQHSPPQQNADRPQISITLAWDGMDHNKTPADAGIYEYEVRAKLLANSEKGPRTQMVSWPKRGTLEVK